MSSHIGVEVEIDFEFEFQFPPIPVRTPAWGGLELELVLELAKVPSAILLLESFGGEGNFVDKGGGNGVATFAFNQRRPQRRQKRNGACVSQRGGRCKV